MFLHSQSFLHELSDIVLLDSCLGGRANVLFVNSLKGFFSFLFPYVFSKQILFSELKSKACNLKVEEQLKNTIQKHKQTNQLDFVQIKPFLFTSSTPLRE